MRVRGVRGRAVRVRGVKLEDGEGEGVEGVEGVAWQAQTLDGELTEVVYDLHSEEEGTDPEDSVSFDLGRAKQGQGNFVAPFPGIHGWYWENRGKQLVIVQLKSSGFYPYGKVYSAAGEVKIPFAVERAPNE